MPREAAELRTIAAGIGAALAQSFPHGAVAKVVIPASWCFCEVLKIDPSGRTEASLAYEFEDRLPVDLEKLTWATCVVNNDYACVAAVFTESTRAFLDGLDKHHVAVELLTVDVTLLLSTSHTFENASFVSAGDYPTRIIGQAVGASARPDLAGPKIHDRQTATLADYGTLRASPERRTSSRSTVGRDAFADRVLVASHREEPSRRRRRTDVRGLLFRSTQAHRCTTAAILLISYPLVFIGPP